MGKQYFIADTHFNHDKIIDYCNRPFNNVTEMNNKLICNWNKVIQNDDDVIYHLGDFAFDNIETIAKFRKKLKGKIFLIMGNHDNYAVKRYYEAGFDKVYDKPILIRNNTIILSHEPVFINNNCPFMNVFGHIHDSVIYKDYTENAFCVSVERINYTPISFEEMIDKMRFLYNY